MIETRVRGKTTEREQVFEQYRPLAYKLAPRYLQTSVPQEDLRQIAALGLLLAIDRFDPDRGRPFPSFAIPTILGELRRHIRDHSRPLHVTRAAQEHAQKVRGGQEQLTARTGRAPTVQELALLLELDQEQVVDGLIALSAHQTSSLDRPLGSDPDARSVEETFGVHEAGFARAEARIELGAAMGQLTERERGVLQMRYRDELSQAAVAARLGCSQMQVSRLQRKAIEKLRTVIAGEGDA